MFAEADDDQIQHANANGWLLLSVNERDFYTWHQVFLRNQWAHSGIATPRQTSVIPRLPLRCAMMLDWISAEYPDTHNRLFRWTDLQQRITGGYMPEGYSAAEIALALGRTP